MCIAVFDYPTWAARYPALATIVNPTLAASYFAEAGLYLDNTDCSRVQDCTLRLALLNMLVAHIATLSNPASAGGAGIVGRITSATEGTVTVAAQYDVSQQAQWFAQTQPGAAYWQATAQYRTMQYVPGRSGPAPIQGAPFGFGRGFLWPR